jgi:hypothetical protein
MYESQYVCAVCQGQGCQIHHIDGNNSNNEEENLILLCNNHHDEAHTNRQLSQNLNAEALRDAKEKWKNAVQEKRELAATASGQLLIAKDSPLASIGITWGYINHNRVAQLARPELLGIKEKQYFDYCRRRGILDQKGILIKPKGAPTSGSYVGNSIYDWYEHGDDLRLHMVYSAFVDQISKSVHPVHIEPRSWTKARIRELLKSGSFIFLERAFYFKTMSETKANQHRRVRAFKRKISMEFYVDTINMFGTTSMTVSFSGHQSCAAILQLKSIEEQDDGGLALHCTPIALGVGFNKDW